MTQEPPKEPQGYDPLFAFAQWYLALPCMGVPRSPADGVSHVGGYTGLVLFRSGQFQVQLWIAPPDSNTTDHRHPNVDVIQVYVSGQLYPRINGEEFILPEHLQERPDGLSSAHGTSLRIRPNDLHGVKAGPLGGAWLNIEQWKEGMMPKNIAIDWQGDALDADHAPEILHKK